MAYIKKLSHLPPGCGALLHLPLYHNPYQQLFQEARRKRFCLHCREINKVLQASGLTADNGTFTCPFCKTFHVSNLTATRVFDQLLLLAGRGAGKTLIGAHAAREEIVVPNSIGWVMGATHKILHDSTFPTLVGLIPPDWIQKWDGDNYEIRFKNGSMLAFRSLQDNPDRARGPHGVGWGWFDEAAEAPEASYDVFYPTLTEAAGIIMATTTVHAGFDWTWDKIEKHAVAKEPGYYAVRYWSEENPLYRMHPVMMAKIERARKIMTPAAFAREYRSERTNAEKQVYEYSLIEQLCLNTDDEVRKFIPEWPEIDPSRKILIGLDEGADHPFGACLIVVTDAGLVVVGEYLERMKAISLSKQAIVEEFHTSRWTPEHINWAANKNALNLRLEFAVNSETSGWRGLANGITVVPAESNHEIGIQRVQAWLLSRQLFFVRAKCPRTIEQMQGYQYAENKTPTGEKKKEAVVKKKDELPDAIRYAVMAWPELPDPDKQTMSNREQKRWDALDDLSKLDIERMREYERREAEREMTDKEAGYPYGEFFGAGTGASVR